MQLVSISSASELKGKLQAVAAVAFLSVGAWALGSPYHADYGKLWGVPKLDYERMIGLDVETSRRIGTKS